LGGAICRTPWKAQWLAGASLNPTQVVASRIEKVRKIRFPERLGIGTAIWQLASVLPGLNNMAK